MRDRISTQVLDNGAIRYAVYDEQGNFLRYEYMLPADEPTDEGTPLNKATLLTDETAQALGLESEDPTVDDALNALSSPLNTLKIGDIYTSARNIEEETDGQFVALDGRTIPVNDELKHVYDLETRIPNGVLVPTDFSVDSSGWGRGSDGIELNGCLFWISSPASSSVGYGHYLNMRKPNGVVSRINVNVSSSTYKILYRLFVFQSYLIVIGGDCYINNGNPMLQSLKAYVYTVANNDAVKVREVGLGISGTSNSSQDNVIVYGVSDDETCILAVYHGSNRYEVDVIYSVDAFATSGITTPSEISGLSKFSPPNRMILQEPLKKHNGRYYLYVTTNKTGFGSDTTDVRYFFELTNKGAGSIKLFSYTLASPDNANFNSWCMYGDHLYYIGITSNATNLYRRKLDGTGSVNSMQILSSQTTSSLFFGAVGADGTLLIVQSNAIYTIDLNQWGGKKTASLSGATGAGNAFDCISLDGNYYILSNYDSHDYPSYLNADSYYYSGTFVFHIPTGKYVYVEPILFSTSNTSINTWQRTRNPLFVDGDGNIIIILQGSTYNGSTYTYTMSIYKIDLSKRVLPVMEHAYLKVRNNEEAQA